jgi:hypothetical protein
LLRHIDIQLTDALPNDPLTTVTHQQSVQLRNAQPASAWPASCS